MLQARVLDQTNAPGISPHSVELSVVSHDRCFVFQHKVCLPFFLCSLFNGLYVCTALNSTTGYIEHAERQGRTRHHAANVSGGGSLLFIKHNGMSELRHRRCVWALFSVTALNFTSQMSVFVAPPLAVVYVWRNKGAFGCRYIHNLPETVSRDLLWRHFAVQWSCMNSSNPDIYFNPLNAELNPICHLLALLRGATIVVVSRLRVNYETVAILCWNDLF